MLAEIRQVYQDSRKPHDIAWNVYVARPLAAVLVAILKRTPLTPNQVTVLGAIVFIMAIYPMTTMLDPMGLLWTALIVELAYVFDCADGQLARIKGQTSDIGGYFDFLIDEFKALVLVGGLSIRVWLQYDEILWLLIGIFGCCAVSIATSLTNFVRRPEYSGEEVKPGASARQPEMPKNPIKLALWLVQRTASFLVHYPSWFVLIALVDFLPDENGAEWFLYLFIGVYLVYIAKTGMGVVLKLASPRFYD